MKPVQLDCPSRDCDYRTQQLDYAQAKDLLDIHVKVKVLLKLVETATEDHKSFLDPKSVRISLPRTGQNSKLHGTKPRTNIALKEHSLYVSCTHVVKRR